MAGNIPAVFGLLPAYAQVVVGDAKIVYCRGYMFLHQNDLSGVEHAAVLCGLGCSDLEGSPEGAGAVAPAHGAQTPCFQNGRWESRWRLQR
jgi:hypothetical protein